MFTSARRLLLAGLTAAGILTGTAAPAISQAPDDVEVLARGPVHEAFATTAEQPTASPVIGRRAPEPIEELPPDEKPDGDNVQWIPGYWHWDDERNDFIWISGFWRAAPPGRVWVSGSWREVRGGFQWVSGFWQPVAAPMANQGIQQPQLEYLPPPPQPLDVAPSVPAPNTTSFYVPGTWMWQTYRYVWRPGFWIGHRPGWVWTPACYRWTPAGYIFVDGYWDYPLAGRGCLFAPVYFRPGFIRPAYIYQPTIVVHEPCLYTSLFVRRGWNSYYFGDYFEPRYSTIGFQAWFGSPRGSGFAVGVTVGRPGGFYDPLWEHYRVAYANNPQWFVGINNVWVGRVNGTVPRPPRTLVQQTTVINNITNVNNTTIVNNVTNNTTIINNKRIDNSQLMVTSIKDVKQANRNITLKPVPKDQIQVEASAAKELRQVAVQRSRLETELAQKSGIPTLPTSGSAGGTPPTPKINAIKLDASKTAIARAQIPKDEKKAPPPSPVKLKTEALNPTKPADPTPVKPNTPVKPPETVKPNTPVKPPETVKPNAPIKPLDPTPVKPNTPVKPPETVKPNTPVKPLDPTPVKPNTPVKPTETVKPNTPVKPLDPTPVKPNTPVKPPETVKPNTPVNPLDPTPVKPNTPVKPPETVKPQPPVNPPKVEVKPNPQPANKPPVDPKPPITIRPPAGNTPPPPVTIKPPVPSPGPPVGVNPPMPQPTPPNVTPPKKPDSGNSKGGDPKGEVRGRRGNDKPDKP